LTRSALPVQIAELANSLEALAPSYFDAALHIETIILDELRLTEVTEMLLELHARLRVRLEADDDTKGASDLIAAIARLTRYQHRFRRERDRALVMLEQLSRADKGSAC
jgi:hypothetical protein